MADRIYMCVAVRVEHTDSWGGPWLYTGKCTLAVSCYASCTVSVSSSSLMCSYLIIFHIFTFVFKAATKKYVNTQAALLVTVLLLNPTVAEKK